MPVKHLNIEGLDRIGRDEPVVMVNLMRFRERALDGSGTGWEAYLRYSRSTAPLIKARGGTIIWAGHAKEIAVGPPGTPAWDYVALVSYPSVAAFLDMMRSPDYETVADPIREAACAEHVIIATREAYSKMAR